MIRVRKARPGDAPTIVDFQRRMAWETEHLRLDPTIVRRGVAAVFRDPTKGAYWVAEIQGRVVASSLILPEWSDWRNGTVLWIHSVYVLPTARRKGAFRALYRHLKRRVERSSRLKGLRLFVDKNNTRARKVYAAMGMDGDHYRLYEWIKPRPRRATLKP